jgi:acyl carrier protein
MDALWRIVCLSTVPQVVISRTDLQERFDTWVRQHRVSTRNYAGGPPALVQKGNAQRGDETKTGSALERSIAEVWKELLGLDHIGRKDNFLDLGGDSLIAVRVGGRLRELVGVTVPPDFFVDEDCTVERLAKEVVTRLLASHDPVVVQRYLDRQNMNIEEKDISKVSAANIA